MRKPGEKCSNVARCASHYVHPTCPKAKMPPHKRHKEQEQRQSRGWAGITEIRRVCSASAATRTTRALVPRAVVMKRSNAHAVEERGKRSGACLVCQRAGIEMRAAMSPNASSACRACNAKR